MRQKVVEVKEVDRHVLLTFLRAEYGKMNMRRRRKTKQPVHSILRASDFSRIKTSISGATNNEGEPEKEKTKFGWLITSPE